MNTVARRFIEELRENSFLPFVGAYDPLWVQVVELTEALLKRIYDQGMDDPAAIERMDLITAAMKTEAGSLQERYLKFVELTKGWKF